MCLEIAKEIDAWTDSVGRIPKSVQNLWFLINIYGHNTNPSSQSNIELASDVRNMYTAD